MTIETTVVVLKAAAKKAGIVVKANFRKADLEAAVLATKPGRIAVYQIKDEMRAKQIVADVIAGGVYQLKLESVGTVDGKFKSLQDMADAVKFKNRQLKAQFDGLVNAIKRETIAQQANGHRLVWDHKPESFMLGLKRRQAA